MSCQCYGNTQPWGGEVYNQWAVLAFALVRCLWWVVECCDCCCCCCLSAVAARSRVAAPSLPLPFPATSHFPPLCNCNQSGSNADCCSMWHALQKSVLIICKTLAIKSFCATCGMSAICALSAAAAAASSHLSHSRIFQSFINTNRVNNEWFTLGKILLCFCHSQRV